MADRHPRFYLVIETPPAKVQGSAMPWRLPGARLRFCRVAPRRVWRVLYSRLAGAPVSLAPQPPEPARAPIFREPPAPELRGLRANAEVRLTGRPDAA